MVTSDSYPHHSLLPTLPPTCLCSYTFLSTMTTSNRGIVTTSNPPAIWNSAGCRCMGGSHKGWPQIPQHCWVQVPPGNDFRCRCTRNNKFRVFIWCLRSGIRLVIFAIMTLQRLTRCKWVNKSWCWCNPIRKRNITVTLLHKHSGFVDCT